MLLLIGTMRVTPSHHNQSIAVYRFFNLADHRENSILRLLHTFYIQYAKSRYASITVECI